MTRARTAAIIGGGIAGPATAMALQKAGIDAVVYEARLAHDNDAGSFLTIASNGINALRTLDADAVLDAGFPTPSITLRSGTGKRLGEAPTGQPLPHGTTSQTITRAALHAALTNEASVRGITIELDKRLVTAERTSDGVRAHFADGTTAIADVLIGCDGVHSTVRHIIDPAAPNPTFAGLVSTGGFAADVEVATPPGTYEMIFGRRGFFGYVVNPDREVWWFANVPRRAPARGELERLTGVRVRKELLGVFADDAGPACALIDATPEIARPTAIHAIPHLPVWQRGAVVVIGDAAHAPSPTSGQGASLAVEDALVLARCLRDLPTEEALARFEARRRPRVERIIRWAARMNNGKTSGPVARVLRDAMLPAVLKLTANSKGHRDVYDFRIEWEAPVSARP